MSKIAIIIGAGPAGLTAALELVTRTDIRPVILEKSGEIGGISRTMNYKGNRMDMGPHRFFSKSDRVMDWWLNIMPLQESAAKETTISYQHKTRTVSGAAGESRPDEGPGATSNRMLVIERLTRIYFLRRFFTYPIQLSLQTLRTLGVVRTLRILVSFLFIRLFPRRPERNLEDFIVNKFGKELYLLFFKDYTEKVWGVPCPDISAEWGAQRIKGVSLGKAIAGAVRQMTRGAKSRDLRQKDTETSLIEQFLYPKYGAGSLWETVAEAVEQKGGKIYFHQDVQKITTKAGQVASVETTDSRSGERYCWEGEYFFSTMPVQELIAGMGASVPARVREVAAGLQYRDFINVGVLLKKMSDPQGRTLTLKDNWIYIQERDVKVGRLMIYNNWGGAMVHDPTTTWIGMEYFCNKTDDLWARSDEDIQALAISELISMGLARQEDVLDATVRRMEKTYPAYFGTYDRFEEIRAYTDRFANLFMVGRNGMHKYNNADHSMLTAMVSVDNIVAGETSKDNIWAINTEQEYHEEKKTAPETPQAQPSPEAAPRGELYPEPSFIDFAWRNNWNRAYVVFAALAFTLQFLLLKWRYPFANYMPDSYSYIEAAAKNLDVNMWPVGYSKFLRLLSAFTHSDKVVVGIQYFFLQCSALLFLYAILYFVRPGRQVKNILYLAVVLNPLALFVSNYISADALFIGCSLLWLTSLVWIVFRPSRYQVLLQGALLLACFTLRYNAIYYPVISALAFALSRRPVWQKFAGVGLGCALVALSIQYTTSQMKVQTGQRQFSAFGGWQLANNALYMYQDIPRAERKPVPARFRGLEAMVLTHFDTLQRVKLTADDTLNTYFYLWSSKGPLIQYMNRQWAKDSSTPYFKRWASEGPLYSSYAMLLISRYPLQFVRSFILPNALKYAMPPDEFLGTYNMGEKTVGPLVKSWFNYKTDSIRPHNKKDDKIALFDWYGTLSALVNTLFLIAVIGLIGSGGLKKPRAGRSLLMWLAVCFWMTNIGFSLFASPIVLRYQALPLMVTLFAACICFEELMKSQTQPSTKIAIS